MDKVAMLSQILSQDPNNAFARYGLAMEYVDRGEISTAIAEFDRLLHQHPDYTPGYQMAAQTLANSGEATRAMNYLRLGVECAQRTGNQQALREMRSLLDDLQGDCI